MARNIDFAFLFRGGANNALLPFKLENLTDVAIDTKPYEAAKKAKNSARQLFTLSTGAGDEADGNLQPHLDKLIAFVKEKTGKKMDTIGSFVIVGSSNGASLALALAAQLALEIAPKLGYVGVCNVNIFPFGRTPAVPNIGPLSPSKGPVFKKLSNRTRAGNAFTPGVDSPHMDEEDPPVVTLQSSINADKDKKRNFFEIQGNHVKFVKRPPGKILPGWWWHSTMPGSNEVHGEVEGFDNKPFVVGGTDDFAFHNSICTGAPFDQMQKEAAEALANFPI